MNWTTVPDVAAARRRELGPGTFAGLILRLLVAAALIIDAVVHLQDAYYYDANAGSLLSEGQLFRIQAVVAIVVAVAVLLWRSWLAWALAALVLLSAFAAVLANTYINIGPVAGLPTLYDPSWTVPGKLVSAWAEGAGGILALTGLGLALALALRARRRRGRGADEPGRVASRVNS